MVAATGTDCHGTHDIKRSKDPDSRTSHANLEATCGKCHGNEAMVREAKLPGGNVASKFHDSIHGQALAGAARVLRDCTNCHGAHSIHPKSDPKALPSRPDTRHCGACHSMQWVKDMRGRAPTVPGPHRSAGCRDCHSPHDSSGGAFVPDEGKECGIRHVDYLANLSRYVPRAGHRTRLLARRTRAHPATARTRSCRRRTRPRPCRRRTG